MRFLVHTKGRDPLTLEMGLMMIEGMRGWLGNLRASGHLVDVWAYAGTQGGGGILEVASHEELNELMAGFPFGQTSDIEVIALSDMDTALDQATAAIKQMMPS